MMRLKYSRLRAPAGMMIGGTAIAAATFVGQGLAAAIPAEILTIVAAIKRSCLAAWLVPDLS